MLLSLGTDKHRTSTRCHRGPQARPGPAEAESERQSLKKLRGKSSASLPGLLCASRRASFLSLRARAGGWPGALAPSSAHSHAGLHPTRVLRTQHFGEAALPLGLPAEVRPGNGNSREERHYYFSFALGRRLRAAGAETVELTFLFEQKCNPFNSACFDIPCTRRLDTAMTDFHNGGKIPWHF